MTKDCLRKVNGNFEKIVKEKEKVSNNKMNRLIEDKERMIKTKE